MFKNFLASFLAFAIAFVPSANAAGPVIWGPSGSAQMLNTGPLVTKDGRTIFSNGALNLVKNTDAVLGTTGYATVGSGTTFAKTTTTSEVPLYPARTTALKISNAGSGTGSTRIVCFQLPSSLKSTKLQVSWTQLPGAGYVAGDYSVDFYSDTQSDCAGTETRIPLSTDSSSVSSLPAATGLFKTTVDTTTADYYELRITRVAGSSGATSWLAFNDFYVGPGLTPQSAIIGDWQTATFTGNWSGSAGYAGKYRRIGNVMEARVGVTLTGAPTGQFSITIPNSLTIDSSAMPDGLVHPLGQAYVLDSSPGANYTGLVFDATSTAVRVISQGSNGGASWNATLPITWASGDYVEVHFFAPIAEWAGSGTVNLAQTDVEYVYNSGTWDAADTTSFGYGPSGGQITGALTAARRKTVRFQTPIQATDHIELQLSDDGVVWLPAIGFSDQGSTVYNSTSWNSTASNNSSAGTYLHRVSGSTTDLQVEFMRYTYIANDDLPVGDWLSGMRWRVVKYREGQPVGFGTVQQSSSGLVKSAGQLLGTNTNDSAATGYVGEYLENNRSTAMPSVTSGTYFSCDTGNTTFNDGNETGITLTAGDWDLRGTIQFQTTGSVALTQLIGFYGTAKGNVTTGMQQSKGYAEIGVSFTAAADPTLNIPTMRVTVANGSTATYYLKGNAIFTGGTSVNPVCNISARRAR